MVVEYSTCEQILSKLDILPDDYDIFLLIHNDNENKIRVIELNAAIVSEIDEDNLKFILYKRHFMLH